MCSIIGYIGDASAAPVIIDGLKKMEYRGYDSVGVATLDKESILSRKGVGRVADVSRRLNMAEMAGVAGIGHTRWATHGGVSDINAHPHMSDSGGVAIVHNGIIENHGALRESLERSGYKFASETDSEVIANLLQRYYDDTGDVKESLLGVVSEITGQYAFIALFQDGTMAAARRSAPLMVGVAKTGLFLSSDVRGFIEYTDEAVYLDNCMCCIIQDGRMEITDYDRNDIRYGSTTVSREFSDTTKDKYAHYTLKEINQQPDVICRAGLSCMLQIRQVASMLEADKYAYATGSGTSYNVALMARQALARFAGIRLDTILSSEMSSEVSMLRRGKVMFAISQSGESADVLEAVRMAQDAGCVIVGLLNVANSSLEQLSDIVIHIDSGPEIGVAATKSFCAQYCVMLRLAEEIAGDTGLDTAKIAQTVSEVIQNTYAIQEIANSIRDIGDIYVLGRGLHYPAAVEVALKIKELTYIHAEAMPGGEMKHGPLALIDHNSYVIVLNPYDSTYGDMLLGAREAKSRGAKIIGISDRNSDAYDHWIKIPAGNAVSYSFGEVVSAQLLSYYTALARNTDPDYPRNLAKSVTVK